MDINIIHLPHRKDRLQLLMLELSAQHISNYTLWDGILDEKLPCRGICNAHKRIVEFARDSKKEEILIAEDDLMFTSQGAFQYFIENKPKQFDLYLASINSGIINFDNSVKDFWGTTFYLISSRFYETFLALNEKRHIDRDLSGKGLFFVCNPFTVIPRDGYSDNMKQIIEYNHCFKERNLFNRF